jgi:hypothetical protein
MQIKSFLAASFSSGFPFISWAINFSILALAGIDEERPLNSGIKD